MPFKIFYTICIIIVNSKSMVTFSIEQPLWRKFVLQKNVELLNKLFSRFCILFTKLIKTPEISFKYDNYGNVYNGMWYFNNVDVNFVYDSMTKHFPGASESYNWMVTKFRQPTFRHLNSLLCNSVTPNISDLYICRDWILIISCTVEMLWLYLLLRLNLLKNFLEILGERFLFLKCALQPGTLYVYNT